MCSGPKSVYKTVGAWLKACRSFKALFMFLISKLLVYLRHGSLTISLIMKFYHRRIHSTGKTEDPVVEVSCWLSATHYLRSRQILSPHNLEVVAVSILLVIQTYLLYHIIHLLNTTVIWSTTYLNTISAQSVLGPGRLCRHN